MVSRTRTTAAALALVVGPFVAQVARADQVISDDLVVQGSACFGNGCVNNMSFGFQTVVISGDAPTVLFHDTSVGVFPTVDWEMGVDHTTFGGFFIANQDSGEAVFAATTDALALGAGSELVTGAISVGSVGAERRIANVADATDGTDAVTLSQMNTLIVNEFAQYQTEMTELHAQVEGLSSELAYVGSATAALSALEVNPKAGNTQVSFGLGNYRGQTAFALGAYSFLLDDRLLLNVAVAGAPNSGYGVARRVGATWGF